MLIYVYIWFDHYKIQITKEKLKKNNNKRKSKKEKKLNNKLKRFMFKKLYAIPRQYTSVFGGPLNI